MNTLVPSLRLIMLALMCLLSTPASGTDYFVSPSGSDTNGDGSIGNPWQTITFAIDRVGPGDVLYLRAGEYHEQLISVRDGTPSAYITISTYNNEDAFIDGQGVTSGNNGCLLSHSYMKFRGFTVRNWMHDGMTFSNCSFIELTKITVTAVTGGISLKNTVHDFLLDSCVMYDYYGGAGGLGFDATPEEASDRIYNGVIRNCKAYISGGAFDNCDGFALGHDGVSDILFSDCETWGIGDGFDISGTRIVLERCSAHDATYGGGYKLWRDSVTLINCVGYNNASNVELDYDFGVNRGVHARLINCTFHATPNTNIWIENTAGGSTLAMYNCILAGGENIGLSFDGDTISCYTGDYNLFHMNAPERAIATSQFDFTLEQIQNGDWTTFSGQDSHSKVVFDASTLFRDTSRTGADLRLKAGALAIDNGASIPNAPTTDFLNLPRSDGRIDIGAYEYSPGSGIEDLMSQGSVEGHSLDALYPNPVRVSGTDCSITYTLHDRATVTLVVVDLLGREVLALESGHVDRGTHRVRFDPSHIPSGLYLVVLRAENVTRTRKMLVAR